MKAYICSHHHITLRAVFFLLLGLGLAGCSAEVNPPHTLRVAVAYAPSSLDVKMAADAASQRLFQLVAPGLVRIDDSGTPQPLLAVSFTHVGYQTFTLTLAEKTFSDGTPVTAEIVKAHYLSLCPATPACAQVKNVVNIAMPTPSRLIFSLGKPDLFFWNALELPISAPGSTPKHLIGAGDYSLNSLAADGSAMLSKRAGNGMPHIELKVVKEPLTRLLMLMKGEIDVVWNDIPDDLYTYGLAQGLNGLSAPSDSYTYIALNVRTAPLNHHGVRQALTRALDREKIRSTLLAGRVEYPWSLLLPENPAYLPQATLDYDISRSLDLLDKAGYGAAPTGTRFHLTLGVANTPASVRLAQVLQYQWRQVGVDVRLNVSDWGTFFTNVQQGQFDMALMTWVGRFDADVYHRFFHSSQQPQDRKGGGLNRGGYSNADMDKQTEIILNTTSSPTLVSAAHRAQQIMAADLPYIPLWRKHHGVLTHARVIGCTLNRRGAYTGLLTCAKTQPVAEEASFR